MRTNDFTAPITSKALNESMFKKFGVKVNFEKYDREQLENYRNILRTKLHQTELSSNFNSLLSNESYQKDKHMMDLLNARIKEMLGEAKKAKPDFLDMDKDGNKKETMKKAIADKKKKKVKEGKASAAEMAHHHAIEYFKHHSAGNLEMAQHHRDACEACGGKLSHGKAGKVFHAHGQINNGMPYECMEGSIGAALGGVGGWELGGAAGSALGGAVGGPVGAVVGGGLGAVGGGIAGAKTGDAITGDESVMREGKKAKKDYDGDGKIESGKDEYLGSRDKAIKKAMAKKKTNESVIAESIARFIVEDEEGKAKTITAGLDMVNDFTSWMQRIATFQTKSMIELSDQIRAHFGDAEAQSFKDAVSGALGQSLEALTQSREAISNSVAVLAGEAPAQEPMGAEPSLDAGDMSSMTEPGMDDAEVEPAGDDFATADAAAGGPETTGRIKRESIERGNRLMKILGA